MRWACPAIRLLLAQRLLDDADPHEQQRRFVVLDADHPQHGIEIYSQVLTDGGASVLSVDSTYPGLPDRANIYIGLLPTAALSDLNFSL
jgi:hypothetical protein